MSTFLAMFKCAALDYTVVDGRIAKYSDTQGQNVFEEYVANIGKGFDFGVYHQVVR